MSLEAYCPPLHGAGQSREGEILRATQPDPERSAASSELRRALEKAIDALPGEFCAVFMLRAVEGLSVADTAESLGIRPETVKTRFHRARRLLRERLIGHFDQALPGAFEFAGERCDRIVAAVLARIASTPPTDANKHSKGD